MATILLAHTAAIANSFWGAVITMFASAIDNYLFAPKTQGQRMDTLQMQSSSYGGMIPIGFGLFRVAGNFIWASNFVEHKHKQRGKGGGSTSYTYTISFAVALCEGPIAGIRRIWVNGTEMSAKLKYRVYTGNEWQQPDPFIEAYNGGKGTTPAYRGLAYIMFQDFDLTNFGSIPQIQIEVNAKLVGGGIIG